MSLATKFRPQKFEECCGQSSIIKILERQLELREFTNCYLFCGASGTGKTTIARIFANRINNGSGHPIEIDGASNNGVDNIRDLIQNAQERSLDSEYKTIILDECVTGDTEVLTNRGWIRFDSLDKSELIAQYNEGKIEFVKPLEFIEREYEGDMYNVKIGNKATFLMSPNHVQPLYYVKSKKIKESYIKDTKFANTNKFIRSGEGVGELIHLSTLDRIALMLQADGCLQNITKEYNYWTIQVKKESKKSRLIELLNSCDLKYKQLHSKREGILRYSIKTPLNITKKLSSYFDISKMSYSYAREFIEELMRWDGSISSIDSKYLYYSCVDKENVDFCQCVGVLGGFKSRIGQQKDLENENHKVIYRLYLESNLLGTLNESVVKSVVNFKGKIYCVKVPSHMILIRRDGFELVTGNCHMLTLQSWNALLKCIEEPPKYTIFMFCTTDPQKIPSTILNRVMRFNLTRVDTNLIKERLKYVCQQEGFTNYDEACDFIAKMSCGGVRDSLAMLEKCATYSNDLNITNVLDSLGNFSYQTYFDLTNFIIDGKEDEALRLIEDCYNSGKDLALFINQYLEFILDLTKYCIFHSMELVKIPISMRENIDYATNIENNTSYFKNFSTRLLKLSNLLKNDTMPKTTIEIAMLEYCRGE